jgi:hypothetical protein
MTPAPSPCSNSVGVSLSGPFKGDGSIRLEMIQPLVFRLVDIGPCVVRVVADRGSCHSLTLTLEPRVGVRRGEGEDSKCQCRWLRD